MFLKRQTKWTLYLLLLIVVVGCDHSNEKGNVIGYWEGTIPMPAAESEEAISYDFQESGLTVTVGLGTNQVVSEWDRWEVHSEQDGDLVLYIYRSDGRTLASLARMVEQDEMLLWDLGTEMTATAAHVRRVERQ